jgi:hypothetical protein
MSTHPTPGQIITTEAHKDAIHVALAPVTAHHVLKPGERVFLNDLGHAESSFLDGGIGIVDPFLCRHVKAGERFWLFMHPNTITGLRHDWSHPAFDKAIPSPSETWLREFAERWEMDYDDMVNGARAGTAVYASTTCYGKCDIGSEWEIFWRHMEVIAGRPLSEEHRDNTTFRCSC